MVDRLRAYAEPNQLFENLSLEPRGSFRDLSREGLGGEIEVSRGVVFGDVDRDGDLDVLVTNTAGPVRLLRNVAPRRGHWLAVRAVDPALGRAAVGALVRLEAAGQSWLRPVTHTYSYLSSSGADVHFGLGEVERVERAVVLWPAGTDGRRTEEAFGPLEVDRKAVLRRGEGRRL